MEFRPNGSAEAVAVWMSRLDSDDEPSEMAALVKLAIAGDSAAFEQIVIRTERRVLNLAYRLLGSLADAQDAAQEVFLRAFKYLHRFDARKPLEPWLIRITVNVCRDMIRNRQKWRSWFADADQPLAELASSQSVSDPHSVLATQQQKQLLGKVLAQLPEKERTALVLRDVEGLTTAEVAEILESSEATVRSQISSARLKIRTALKAVRR
jgi:RNA polymerase sigma-70 factor (ECF subfamily)